VHFIWALLLRIDKIANYSLRVNTENTELQKIICEMEKIAGEPLNVSLLCWCSAGVRAANYFSFNFFFTILCNSAVRRSL
jgi:hypothetical protein